MSFFKRNKDTTPEHKDDALTPEIAVESPSTEGPTKADDEPTPDVPQRRPEMVATREQIMDVAFDGWHQELTQRASAADKREAERAPGRIDLTQIHPTASVQFYGYQATRLSSLIREERSLAQAKVQLARLREDLDITAQTYGHAPASLAVGSMTWTELPELSQSDSPIVHYDVTGELKLSPDDLLESVAETIDQDDSHIREAQTITEVALFRPVRLFFPSQKEALIQLVTAVEINPVVIRALRNHGAAAEELATLRQLATEGGSVDVLITRLNELGRIYLPGFSYESRVILGSFFQPERMMLADLEAMEPYIRTSPVMLALAGDQESRDESAQPLPAGNVHDRNPDQERGVGDLDVAELDVVEAVASGRSLLVDCPPGSQRSATMAAIAADTVASGHSLIIVPSRASSAADVVSELEKHGLADLVADFSDVEAIPMRLRTGMRVERPELPLDETLAQRTELMRVRSTLETFMRELHDVSPRWGVSVYDMLEKLAASTEGAPAPLTRVRFDSETLNSFAGEGLTAVRHALEQAGQHHAFDPSVAHCAWTSTDIADPVMGQKALEAAQRLHEETVPTVVSQSSRAAGETGLQQASNLAQWLEQIDVLDGIAQSLDIFVPQIFETSPMDMVIATASREWRDSNGHTMRGGERRRFKKQAQDLVRPGAIVKDLHAELSLVQERRETWRRYTAEGGWPQLPQGLAHMQATSVQLMDDLTFLSEHLGNVNFVEMPFDQLQRRIAELVADGPHMEVLPKRNAALNDLRERGLGRFVDDMLEREVLVEHIDAEFDLAYWSSIFEQLIVTSSSLAHLGPQDLADLLASFQELDAAHCESLAGPVKLAVVNNARALMIDRKNDTLKLDALLARHGISVLRDVIATYQRLVQVARPVWIVPATIAAEFIPPMPWVDVVMMDVSDNATVASVASTVTRGRQMVVLGDVRRAHIVEHENGALRAFSGVLPVRELPTNRARLDGLSLRALRAHGYDDVLPQIPSVASVKQSQLVVVDGRGVPSSSADGAVEAPKVEVDAVVDAVLAHAMSRPDESLAVITVSPAHAHRIREALRHLGTESQELSALYAGNKGEPFVVVDIFSAASVRRDHVILSVGYGKTVHGRVLHSFGALSTPLGLTGMIDAIEAARGSMTIISSLAPGDISLKRVSTPGPRLLAQLLAEAGGYVADNTVPDSVGEIAPLLSDLARRIENSGFVTRANVGQGDWSIPLIVGHPDIPGQWAVAVVYDDVAYARQASLRRRDRYRIDALKYCGWEVYQTFSTSLFVDPQGQAEKIIDLVRSVLNQDDPDIDLTVPDVNEWGDPAAEEEHEAPRIEPKKRSARPAVIPGLQLAGYTDNELEELLTWIASDEIQRTTEEFVTELRNELALRRGSQIDRVLANIVRRVGVASDE
ncbi:hypothetical protein [Arcanobacterium phocae]|uniref:hypothetical protein n=1 Tax=Arcanobacterium phocae TaxID=131112 RepID=UPI001C0F2108|nr:hypothetical protein [Arcanobacterium phocae]